MPKLLFYHVKTNPAKLATISNQVQKMIEQNKKILILVPNEESAKFIDSLLWKMPEESFIPHVVTNSPTKDWVVITTSPGVNVNQAHCLFNLNSDVPQYYEQFSEVFELFDETSPQKAEQSKNKLEKYREKGLEVVMIAM